MKKSRNGLTQAVVSSYRKTLYAYRIKTGLDLFIFQCLGSRFPMSRLGSPFVPAFRSSSPDYKNIDSWHPVMPNARRGRSAIGFAFPREALGQHILSQHRYAFADCLLHQNEMTIMREDTDPAYCGEVSNNMARVIRIFLTHLQINCLPDVDSSADSESGSKPESEEPFSPPVIRTLSPAEDDSLFDSDTEQSLPYLARTQPTKTKSWTPMLSGPRHAPLPQSST